MFGLTTKRRADARELISGIQGFAAAEKQAIELIKRELMPVVEEARARIDGLERDLAISREREAESREEVRRLRAKLRGMVEFERISEKDWRILELEAQVSSLQADQGADAIALFSPGEPVRFQPA